MKNNALFSLIVIHVFLASCSSDAIRNVSSIYSKVSPAKIAGNETNLEPSDYIKWIQDKSNGFIKTKQLDDMHYSLQYRNAEYVSCLEERSAQIHQNVLQTNLERMKSVKMFDLKIWSDISSNELLQYQIQSQEEYNERLTYFAFKMQNDLKLVIDNDTLCCSMFHFERNYGISNSLKFLLAFDVPDASGNKEMQLIYHDQVFNKGLIKFLYPGDIDLKKPHLSTVSS